MRWIFYAGILALTFLAPVKRLDVAKLLPIEAVAVSRQGNEVVLQTDCGNKGSGETVQKALEALKVNATEIIYLDTAEYLLIAEGAEADGEALLGELRRGVKTGLYTGGDVREEARWLDAHRESGKPQV